MEAGDVRDRRQPRGLRPGDRPRRARPRAPGMGQDGLVQAVQDELGTKVGIENDVNLAALGEQWLGLGKGVSNFVYLHVGTGVGAGLVLNGELSRADGGGGRGRLPADRRRPEGSDPAAARRPRHRGGRVRCGRGRQEAGDEAALSARNVFAAARRGDAVGAARRRPRGRTDRARDRGHRSDRRSRTRHPRRRDRPQRRPAPRAGHGGSAGDLPVRCGSRPRRSATRRSRSAPCGARCRRPRTCSSPVHGGWSPGDARIEWMFEQGRERRLIGR